MLETECFQELNVFYANGLVVPDLRRDGGLASAHLRVQQQSRMGGFFQKFFRRKVDRTQIDHPDNLCASQGRSNSAFNASTIGLGSASPPSGPPEPRPCTSASSVDCSGKGTAQQPPQPPKPNKSAHNLRSCSSFAENAEGEGLLRDGGGRRRRSSTSSEEGGGEEEGKGRDEGGGGGGAKEETRTRQKKKETEEEDGTEVLENNHVEQLVNGGGEKAAPTTASSP